MKSIGIVRNVDQLGRVVLPKELRRTMGLPARTLMEFYVEGDKIIIKKFTPWCAVCDSMVDVKEYNGKYYCRECRLAISSL